MRRFIWFGLAACLLIAVAACGGPTGNLKGATPVGYIRPVATPIASETPESVTIADLLETPETYEGQIVEISGLYYRRPVIVCSARSQLSPARWAIADTESRILARGSNETLEELPSGQIQIDVIGRWLRWQGPVGCGRQAQITEVWYLDVSDIVSPNPIALVPGSGGGLTVQLETPDTAGGYPGPGEEPGDAQITGTITFSGTLPSQLPGPVGTPILAPPTATPTAQLPGPIPSETPSVSASETTPTATSSAATASPTTENGGSAPTATSTGGGNVTTVDQEELPPGSIETAQLGLNEIHRWPLVITSTAVITVNVASEIGLDIGITIVGPFGDVIVEQNFAQGGSPEILAAVPLTQLGDYEILISSENAETGYYAILVLDDESYTFVFNDTLEVGQSATTNMREENDHFWFFFGTAGEVVTIRVTPTDLSDLFIRFFGPNDTLLVDFHDETGAGEVEELLSFTLPDTGFYSILVGEFDFGAAVYSIDLIEG